MIRSAMGAKWIRNSCTSATVFELYIEKKLFQYLYLNGVMEDDGPTMIWYILTKTHPSTMVGVCDLKKSLANVTLATYQEDVPKMLKAMHRMYNEILEKGSTHNDYIINLFWALRTSKCDRFEGYIDRLQQDWQTRKITLDECQLRQQAIEQYNNMNMARDFNSVKKNDGLKAKILALTTELKSLKERSGIGLPALAPTPNPTNTKQKNNLPVWKKI